MRIFIQITIATIENVILILILFFYVDMLRMYLGGVWPVCVLTNDATATTTTYPSQKSTEINFEKTPPSLESSFLSIHTIASIELARHYYLTYDIIIISF